MPPHASGSLGSGLPPFRLHCKEDSLFLHLITEGELGLPIRPWAPPPSPTYSTICLPPPPPSKLPQNLPDRSWVLSICCLDCSSNELPHVSESHHYSQMVVLHFSPPPSLSLELKRAFSLGPLAGGRGKPEGLGKQGLSGPCWSRPSWWQVGVEALPARRQICTQESRHFWNRV